jgi:hypothetical protein
MQAMFPSNTNVGLFHLIVSEIRSSTPRTMSRTASIAAERVSESRDERVDPPGPSAYRGA